MSLSGVSFFTAENSDNVDPFFPALYGRATNITEEKEVFDQCMGHPSPQGLYHFHFMPPCVANPN
jgi:hypothetical protein